MRLLCGVLEVRELSLGALDALVVTAPESKISCGMFSRSVAQSPLLLQFWQMEAW